MPKCKKVYVEKDVCSLQFGKGYEYDHASDKFHTVRGELMVIHMDKGGKVIEIELIGSKQAIKPCQD